MKIPFYWVRQEYEVLDTNTGSHWTELWLRWAGDHDVVEPPPPLWELPRPMKLSAVINDEVMPPSYPQPFSFYRHSVQDELDDNPHIGYVFARPPKRGMKCRY